MRWPDPYCTACGRPDALSECLIPRRALGPAPPGAPPTVRMNLCVPCMGALRVLPLTEPAHVTIVAA